MILVESTHQLELWQQAAQEATRQLHLAKPLAAVIGNLAVEAEHDRAVSQKGGSRSMWNYNRRHLMTNAPYRLQEMPVPMTHEHFDDLQKQSLAGVTLSSTQEQELTLKLHVRMTSWELLQKHGPLARIWTAVLLLPSEHPSRLRRLLDMEVARSTRS